MSLGRLTFILKTYEKSISRYTLHRKKQISLHIQLRMPWVHPTPLLPRLDSLALARAEAGRWPCRTIRNNTRHGGGRHGEAQTHKLAICTWALVGCARNAGGRPFTRPGLDTLDRIVEVAIGGMISQGIQRVPNRTYLM
jgi:hypothetical protein